MQKTRRFQDQLIAWLARRLPLILGLALLVVIALYGLPLLYAVPWSGLGAGEAAGSKTLWDWMQLFVLPLFLALVGFGVGAAVQRTRRELAAERLREEALQTFLGRMSELLLDKGLGYPTVPPHVRQVARALTLTTLAGLDGKRKGMVVRFLYESGLIAERTPLVDLADADLSGADLRDTDLPGVNLRSARLEGAHLENARLQWARLDWAHLEGAYLQGASMDGATLQRAHLEGAHLERASLVDADLWLANLDGAHLHGADISPAQLAKTIVNEQTTVPNPPQSMSPVEEYDQQESAAD